MVKVIAALLFILLSSNIRGQAVSYNYFYRITFIDKKASTSDYMPWQLLSEKAIARRKKAGIDFLDYRDLPVNKEDIKVLTDLGLILHSTSKWMNSALMKSITPADIPKLLLLPNVAEVKTVRKPGTKSSFSEKLKSDLQDSQINRYDVPVSMLNGYTLHDQGFKGQGILIAVLDAGFDNAEEITSLEHLRNRGGIKATYDFVQKNNIVYNSHTHGTAVLSILAGKIPMEIEGTAQDADYLLLKTEDSNSEYPCEEDYWAAGAEFADSAGADIITSSLGYSTFDDPSMNYAFSDLDGSKSFVTRVADIAASKGILVVNSAGNERDKIWKRIICPADGKNVIAVGAVDDSETISTFSSAGPSFDRRIKPDFVALGVKVPLQTSNTSIVTANGTSFSCPVISGMTACLMQAVPEAKNSDIIKIMRESADRVSAPDSLYGYGIPDMGIALLKLQDLFIRVPEGMSLVSPNPTTGEFEITFREAYETIVAEIFTASGRIIWKKEIDNFAGKILKVNELINREHGLYIIRITTPSSKMVHKVIKLRN